MPLAIVVACLPSYRAFFVMKSRSQNTQMYREGLDTRPLQYNKYGEAIMLEQQSQNTSGVHIDTVSDLTLATHVPQGPLGV